MTLNNSLNTSIDLADFGWTNFFQTQLSETDQASLIPARVVAIHRNGLQIAAPSIDELVSPLVGPSDDDECRATVGDWLLIDRETRQPRGLLQRRSLFKRRAPGEGRRTQLIAANLDTLFIVSSCNRDFNIARLERYLALALEAEVRPIIVLTKADLTDTPEEFTNDAGNLLPGLLVEFLDARSREQARVLAPWCGRGQTVALLGSSGVGKSTLVNTLLGADTVETQGIREDDAKGRHTTTGRALHRLPTGGWLLDTPGMRELQLTDVKTGLDEVFSDIVELVDACRFADCQHNAEPGCAIREAINTGALETNRLKRWRKLAAEETYNSESLAERRARGRAFGKMIKGNKKRNKRRFD
jgi:ribosome biogenesis GTPase